MQLPARIAGDWLKQREALLQNVASVLGASSSGSHMTTGGCSAAADAAAADRAMQELLVRDPCGLLANSAEESRS
jgi:hypothetical protein